MGGPMLDLRTKVAGVLLPAMLYFLALSSPAFAGRHSDAPPPGIRSTAVKLQTVLDANDEAVGSLTHRSTTNIETGTLQAYGLSGTFRNVYTGLHSSSDYHKSFALPPLSFQEGQYKGQRWRRNENGITTDLHPDYSSRGSDVKLLAADALNPKNDVKLLGEVTDPFTAYVVQVKRKYEAPYWLFYDKATSLLTRAEIGYPDERHVIVLDDFRLANGVKEAWHTHETTVGNSANDWDERIVSDVFGAPVTDSDLKIPKTNDALVQFPATKTWVALPATFNYGDIVVRVSINGRGLDMILDTAFSGMLLNTQVVKDLRLPTYGPRRSGSPDGTVALVRDMAVGDLTMRDVFVTCEPFDFHENGPTKVVGIVGFDFLASTVTDVDYENKKVGAASPRDFKPPATPYMAPMNLDEGIPMIPAHFGKASGTHFVLNTASPSTYVFPAFWEANADLTPDPKLFKSAYGKTLWMAPVKFKVAEIGGIILGDVVVRLVSADSPLGISDHDGDLGQNLLQLFHTYLDYGHQLVYFVPSADLKKQLESLPPGKGNGL
jgi:hypothetical protein